MTLARLNPLRCDVTGCSACFPREQGETPAQVRKRADSAGWLYIGREQVANPSAVNRAIWDKVADWPMVDLCPHHADVADGTARGLLLWRQQRRDILRMAAEGRKTVYIANTLDISTQRVNGVVRRARDRDERQPSPDDVPEGMTERETIAREFLLYIFHREPWALIHVDREGQPDYSPTRSEVEDALARFVRRQPYTPAELQQVWDEEWADSVPPQS